MAANHLAQITSGFGMAAVTESTPAIHRVCLGKANELSLTIGELAQLLEQTTPTNSRFVNGFRIQSARPVQDGTDGPARPITFCLADGQTAGSMLATLDRVVDDGWPPTAPVYLDASTDTARVIHSIRGLATGDPAT